ncbi:hypothetical protein K6Y31_03420 [Motilimonas cestriensis]|uniref:Cadmium carbonic anhydrase n=1 Tax=Motilimonas cestriensis TaxID=2742685 RepID=A0ABS8W5R6_9GAMM|nr:delta-class carbonic anhydrase [Motilimonas cestriensis]MCE2593860.1 hypothetical protein [Motilimonas cestriensis]
MNKNILMLFTGIAIMPALALAANDSHHAVADSVIAQQRAALAESTKDKGYGPQAPRDIDTLAGTNTREFGMAPPYTAMNLCNIHFHKNAEHKGGEFNKYAGNGDGHGYNSGYVYTGKLTAAELAPFNQEVGAGEHNKLQSGDTIEVHFVHSTAQVKPGPTLGSCLNDAIGNPQLRVETQVYVVVNDKNALDFVKQTEYGLKDGLYQAINIPTNTGEAIQYAGSTTGPSYNEKGSPFQVTWSVRPQVAKVNIATVAQWLKGNDFNEDHAHGVRNLVVNPDLLSDGH